MGTEATAAPAAQVDALEYVRERLNSMNVGVRMRLAADIGVSLSTVYNIMKGERDAKYGTVMTLHRAIKELEAAAPQ